jgi:prephenate dehydrogenase
VRILIAGLGLIGTSLALDLTALGHEIWGYDVSPEHCEAASAAGAIRGSIPEMDGRFDCIVLAAPPKASIALLDAPWQAPLWLDTGSVKQPICAAARQRGLPFVGGHPLAGNAGSGPGAAQTGLFAGRGFALCAGGGPGEAAEALVRSVGAVPIWLDPGDHDREVAVTSHLCYTFSCALALMLKERPVELLGPAALEMLRVATSPTGLWQEILDLNSPAVEAATRELGAMLADVAQGLPETLEAARRAATTLREEVGYGR